MRALFWVQLAGLVTSCAGANTHPLPAASPAVIERVLIAGRVTCIFLDELVLCTGVPPLDPTRAPVALAFREWVPRGLTDLACTDNDCCAGYADGTVRCWGGDYHTSQRGDPLVRFPGRVRATGTGPEQGCALLEGGATRCWGTHSGQGSRPSQHIVVPHGLRPASELAWSGHGACAIEIDGTVMCWHTRLGDGSGQEVAPFPVRALLPRPVSNLAGSSTHVCAVHEGQVYCWGPNAHGELGSGGAEVREPGDPIIPRRALLMTRAVDVSAGQQFTCALDANETVWCWGLNEHGQVGDGSTRVRTRPVRVGEFPGARGVVAGERHACVWTEASVHCWGARVFPVEEPGCSDTTCLTPVLAAGTESLRPWIRSRTVARRPGLEEGREVD